MYVNFFGFPSLVYFLWGGGGLKLCSVNICSFSFLLVVSEAARECLTAIESKNWNIPIPRMEHSDSVNERNPLTGCEGAGLVQAPPSLTESHSLAVTIF